jgi:heterogeneous nuclear ribonucleoprotein A1/A3
MADTATNKLFVGSISWNTTWQELKEAFAEFGNVGFVKIVTDRETGRSKGFGFVEFETVEEATAAKEAMDGKELDGRPLKVDFAEEKPQQPEA